MPCIFSMDKNQTILEDIISLDQLKLEIEKTDDNNVLDLVERIEIPLSEYAPFAHWSKKSYTRNCIAASEDYELILLCWEPGQKTAIHCHGGEECAVLLLDGEMHEKRFRQLKDGQLEIYSSVTIPENGPTYMTDDLGFHSLENIGNTRSMSLHLYMKPIKSCKVFNDKLGKFETKQLKYTHVAKDLVAI